MSRTLFACLLLLSMVVAITEAAYGYYTRTTYYYGRPYYGYYRPTGVNPVKGAITGALVGAVAGAVSG
ncbi:unnamed protein product [Nippostrongylus brasiliensis]|uniref:Glycine zipper 2TM domain-containing protein n=1 Tax=Nippostrongylus brasiliensis TaxID=27835 RepID=A0A0N4Y9D6_NIPBR|nr:hypothetical protein Q1695_005243 [Nippostrongylus brasiliensis]VDL76496.1 unnamed protein product [Nippostrongylus brasiliensis]